MDKINHLVLEHIGSPYCSSKGGWYLSVASAEHKPSGSITSSTLLHVQWMMEVIDTQLDDNLSLPMM